MAEDYTYQLTVTRRTALPRSERLRRAMAAAPGGTAYAPTAPEEGNKGDGHRHKNLELLDRFIMDSGLYLLVRTIGADGAEVLEKIRAAFADRAAEAGRADVADSLSPEAAERFLSAIGPDAARGLITFLEGLTVGEGKAAKSADYRRGMSGKGFAMERMEDGTAHAEADTMLARRKVETPALEASAVTSPGYAPGAGGGGFSLTVGGDGRSTLVIDDMEVRRRATFNELEVRRTTSVGGRQISTPGGGVTICRVVEVNDAGGRLTGWLCTFKVDDGKAEAIENPFRTGYQLICQSFNLMAGVYAGCENRYWWRTVTEVGFQRGMTAYLEVIRGEDGNYYGLCRNEREEGGEHYVLLGADEVGSIEGYFIVSATRGLPADSTYAPKPGDVAVHLGCDTELYPALAEELHPLSHAIVISSTGAGSPEIAEYVGIHGYSKTLDAYRRNRISPEGTEFYARSFHVTSGEGEDIPVNVYRGAWDADTYYNYREQVTHADAFWICNVRPGCRGEEPSHGTTAWTPISSVGHDGGKGDKGDPGADGADGRTMFKSTAFLRSVGSPAQPEGGTFLYPIPGGWHDGVPDGEETIWFTTRTFTSDGLPPQDGEWATPRILADSADFDVEFSSYAQPDPPMGHPNQNGQWDNAATPGTLWMATSVFRNGAWTEWEVAKIKGETGEPGAPGMSTFTSYAFRRSAGKPPRPEGGTYADPLPGGGEWSDGVPAGDGRLWMSSRTFTSDGLPPQTSRWTDPALMADNPDFDVEYSAEELPGPPAGHPNTNPQWTDDSTIDPVWMATAHRRDGEWGPWTVWRIKGEKGDPGADGKPGTDGNDGKNGWTWWWTAAGDESMPPPVAFTTSADDGRVAEKESRVALRADRGGKRCAVRLTAIRAQGITATPLYGTTTDAVAIALTFTDADYNVAETVDKKKYYLPAPAGTIEAAATLTDPTTGQEIDIKAVLPFTVDTATSFSKIYSDAYQISLHVYEVEKSADGIKSDLIDTGIDIKSRLIKMKADRFILENNAGEKTFAVNAAGDLEYRGDIASKLMDITGGVLTLRDGNKKPRVKLGVIDGTPMLRFLDAQGNETYTLTDIGLTRRPGFSTYEVAELQYDNATRTGWLEKVNDERGYRLVDTGSTSYSDDYWHSPSGYDIHGGLHRALTDPYHPPVRYLYTARRNSLGGFMTDTPHGFTSAGGRADMADAKFCDGKLLTDTDPGHLTARTRALYTGFICIDGTPQAVSILWEAGTGDRVVQFRATVDYYTQGVYEATYDVDYNVLGRFTDEELGIG